MAWLYSLDSDEPCTSVDEALERWVAAGMYYAYPAEPLPPALLEGCKVNIYAHSHRICDSGGKLIRCWLVPQRLRFTNELYLRDPPDDASDDVSFHIRRMRQVGSSNNDHSHRTMSRADVS